METWNVIHMYAWWHASHAASSSDFSVCSLCMMSDNLTISSAHSCWHVFQEDDKLTKLVNQFGPKNWSKLARQLPGRAGKQCRERWVWTFKKQFFSVNSHFVIIFLLQICTCVLLIPAIHYQSRGITCSFGTSKLPDKKFHGTDFWSWY